ncbi:hypothetical protein [Lysobacter sp. cf310]|uniref:hypothetical protein n=1 Tax=Lysobacter sp. cf310 TaxID=1761790 RepID=UPI0008F1EE9E|nr:hypothetical protein [Lysobacter sp. cf310]SFL09160.1 hypothetical protein SAMN04487938_3183 [Lysobacter sp. cf310]
MSVLSIYKDLLFMQGYLTDHRFFDPPEAVPAAEAKAVVPKPILAGVPQAAARCASPGAIGACC